MSRLQSVWLLAALWVSKVVLVCLKKASLIYRLHLYFIARKESLFESRSIRLTRFTEQWQQRWSDTRRNWGYLGWRRVAKQLADRPAVRFTVLGETLLGMFLPLRANCAGTETSEPSWSFNGFYFQLKVFILQSADSLHSPHCLPCFYFFAPVAVWSRDAAKQSGSKLCSHQANPVQQRAGKPPHTCGRETPEWEDADSLTDEWKTSCSRFKSVDDLWARFPGVCFYLLDKQASKNEGDL